MTSPTQWTWVGVDSGSRWWTGRPRVLQFMGSQRVGHNWATELNWMNWGNRVVLQEFCCHCWSVCKSVLYMFQTLCDPKDCSIPGSSVHGIFQTRILEWVATSFSRISSPFRDRTCVSCIDRQILYHWATRKTLELFTNHLAISLLQTYNYNSLIFLFHFCCSVTKSCLTLCNPMDFKVAAASHVLCRDLWPPEERISIWGQRQVLTTGGFCVKKFY